MHIGLDARLTYYRRMGGISTYIRQMVSALEKLDAANEYTVFHSRKAKETISQRFRRANLWTPSHNRLERLALTVELARFQLDVLHTTDFIPPVRGARRHVVSIHDLTFLHYPQFLTDDSRRYYNGQIQAAVRRADHILTISQSSKDDIVKMLGVPAEMIAVQWCGVDDIFKPLPRETLEKVRQLHDLPSDFILFVGTFEPRKNIAGLVQAYSELRKQLPDAPPLLLVGKKGWLFDETMSKIDVLGLHNHILWRDNIDHAALPAVYGLAAVLVMPSFYEGFGLPALEAMACGTVPIVSNRSSLPEVVGDVGQQVDPDDTAALTKALHLALTDEPWRNEMREKGLAQAATFTWERSARIALSIYEKVI
jgi:glycosyltransferase involved in cell wall biosynthesis